MNDVSIEFNDPAGQNLQVRSIFVRQLDDDKRDAPAQLFAKNGMLTLKYLKSSFPGARTLMYLDRGMKTFLEVDQKDNILIPPNTVEFFVVLKPEGMNFQLTI